MVEIVNAPPPGKLPIDPGLAKLCDEGEIEIYDSKIVAKLSEAIGQSIKTETKWYRRQGDVFGTG